MTTERGRRPSPASSVPSVPSPRLSRRRPEPCRSSRRRSFPPVRPSRCACCRERRPAQSSPSPGMAARRTLPSRSRRRCPCRPPRKGHRARRRDECPSPRSGTPASAILTIAGDGGAADAPLPQQAAVSLPAASEGTSGEAPRRMSEPAPASPTIEAAGSDASVATAGLSPPQSKSGPAAGPLTVRIVLPAAGTEPRAAGSSASLALVASVIAEPGAATAASTLLRSPLGTLALTPRLAVPPGSLLLLELPGSLPNFAPDGGDHDGATTAAWPSLQTAL